MVGKGSKRKQKEARESSAESTSPRRDRSPGEGWRKDSKRKREAAIEQLRNEDHKEPKNMDAKKDDVAASSKAVSSKKAREGSAEGKSRRCGQGQEGKQIGAVASRGINSSHGKSQRDGGDGALAGSCQGRMGFSSQAFLGIHQH